jgi:uncharacterized protein (DUF1697 family)
MGRYAAFLRAVGPTTLKMPDLKRSLEAAGFTDVRTLLSSGNAVFSARSGKSIERKVEDAMKSELGRTFLTIVRSIDDLRDLLASDPYKAVRLPDGAKRVVTFLREKPASKVTLPVERDGATIVRLAGLHAFSAYVSTPRGPVFMELIEKTFGKNVTTRTWDTVAKVVRAADSVSK